MLYSMIQMMMNVQQILTIAVQMGHVLIFPVHSLVLANLDLMELVKCALVNFIYYSSYKEFTAFCTNQ